MYKIKNKKFYQSKDIVRKLIKEKNIYKIYNKVSKITKTFLNKRVQINYGKENISVLITDMHIGSRFGEYVFSRKIAKHKNKKLKGKTWKKKIENG